MSTSRIIAQGQLASSKGTIYDAGTNSRVVISSIHFHNTAGSTQTILLYAKASGGSSRVIARFVLLTLECAQPTENPPIILGAGDILEAYSTNATSVDYTITGEEFPAKSFGA